MESTVFKKSLNLGEISELLRSAEQELERLLEEEGFDNKEDFESVEEEKKQALEEALIVAESEKKIAKAKKLRAELTTFCEIRAVLDKVEDLQRRKIELSDVRLQDASAISVKGEKETEFLLDTHESDVKVDIPADKQTIDKLDVEALEESMDGLMLEEVSPSILDNVPSDYVESAVEREFKAVSVAVESEKNEVIIQEGKLRFNLKSILSLPPEWKEDLTTIVSEKKLKELNAKYRQALMIMPECAEKSLLLLLSHFENEDIKLTFMSEDTVQQPPFISEEKIDIILEVLESQLLIEALTDRYVNATIKEIKKLLSEKSTFNDLFNELFKLLKYIRPLDLDLMLELIGEALEAADKIKDKDVIQLLGGTGTGKSTTIHFLAGSTMELTEVDGIPHIAPVRIVNPEVESFITSPYARSETRIINALSINLLTLDESKQGEITLCDSPGFDDTGGPEIDIANGIGVVRALKGCHSVKPVILVSGDSIGARFEGLVRLATILAALMPDLESALPSFSYIFTKFSKNQHQGVVAKLKNKKRELKPEERANRGFIALFNDMIEKTEKNIFILDPIHDNPFTVIDLLNARPSIENPKENFHDFATPDSMAKLKEQLFKHKTSIEKALERMDVPLLIFKIHQLARVNETIALHEGHKYYDIAITWVTHLIEALQEKIAERLVICLDPRNTYVESDITDCSLRMRDLYHLEEVRVAYLPSLSNLQQYVSMHITQLQHTLYGSIQSVMQNSTEMKEVTCLSMLVDLNKMQIISKIFSNAFLDIPESAEFVKELETLYNTACADFISQFNHYREVAHSSLIANEFVNFVNYMDLIEQMSHYYGGHLQDFPMREHYMTLSNAISEKWKDLTDNLKQCLSGKSVFIEEAVVNTVKMNIEILYAGFTTYGMFSHCSEETMKVTLVEFERIIYNYFVAVKATLIDACWDEKGSEGFFELFNTIAMLDRLRENSKIAYATGKIYQDIVRQIEGYVNHLKEVSIYYLKLLHNSQPGTLLSIDYKVMLEAVYGLKRASIFDGHRERIYQNELGLLKEYFTGFLVDASEMLTSASIDLNLTDSLEKSMIVVEQLKGIVALEVYMWDDEAPVTELLAIFDSKIYDFFENINDIYFTKIFTLDVEKLVQLFAFLRLTSGKMLEKCNHKIFEVQAKLEIYLRQSVATLEHELTENNELVLTVQPCALQEGIERAQKIANTLIFFIELKQAHSRVTIVRENSFEHEIFQLIPDRIFSDWIHSASGTGKIFSYIQSLHRTAEQIEAGVFNDRVYDIIKILSQLRALDKYLPEGFSCVESISRLDTAIRTHELTLMNELKLLASTGKYVEFNTLYEQAILKNPEIQESLQVAVEMLMNAVKEQIEKNQRRLDVLTINESSMETLKIILEDVEALTVIQPMLCVFSTTIDFSNEIIALRHILSEKLKAYHAHLQDYLSQGKFYKVEINLQALNKLLKDSNESDFSSEYRVAIQSITEKTNQQVEAEIQQNFIFYTDLSFEEYAKNPPVLFMSHLKEAAEFYPRYSSCADEMKEKIILKINAVIERVKNAEATAEDQANLKSILELGPYLPVEIVASYADELRTLEEQLLQRDETLKRASQEELSAGKLTRSVDKLHEKVKQNNYRDALTISRAIWDAISSTAERFRGDIAKGDLVTVLLHLPKSWEDWFYYEKALSSLSSSVQPRYQHLFSGDLLKNTIADMIQLVSSQCKVIVDRVLSGIDDKKFEISSFRIIKADFDKLAAMLNLIYFYQKAIAHDPKAETFYSDLLNTQPRLTENIFNGLKKMADFLRHNQMMFMTGLYSDSLSSLRVLLDAVQENSVLVETVVDFSKNEIARHVIPELTEILSEVMPYSTMQATLSKRLLELQALLSSGFLHNPELNIVDQSKHDDFYSRLSHAYASLTSAHLLASHTDSAIADVRTLEGSVKRHIIEELKKLETELLTLLSRFPTTEAESYIEFNIWVDSFRSFREKFKEPSLVQVSESSMKSIERAFEDRIKVLRDSLVEETDLNLLSHQLILLKLMSIALPRFMKKINKEIDAGLFTVSKERNGAQKLASLGLLLRQIEGDEQDPAIRLINEHSAFEGFAVSIRNEKTLRYKSEQVLGDLRGDKIEVSILAKAIKEHEKIYWGLVEDGLVKIDEAKESIVINARKIARSACSPVEKMVGLSAHLFAYWTLENSSRYLDMVTAVESTGSPISTDSGNSYLLQPHSAQIISVFRLLGIDASTHGFENHLVQIGTGEGKSVTLAMTASILALMGYEIDCVCYSEYLSQRDYDAFVTIFKAFGLLDQIHYGTFNQLSENFINQYGDTRELIVSHIQGAAAISKQSTKSSDDNKILLIDEVDVFFSPDFYGNSYRPLTQLQDVSIFKLIEFIWRNRRDKRLLTFENIKSTEEFRACISRYRGWDFLIETAVKAMLSDIQTFEKHEYVILQDGIGYKEQDGISLEISYGYKTVFAYFKEHEAGKITQSSRDKKVAITIDCGIYSYAEIPRQYRCIMGVTGTLATLSKPEKEILDLYNMRKFTYMPSVYGSNQLEFSGNSIRDVIIESKAAYFIAVGNEIHARLIGGSGSSRAILIFFENKTILDEFYDSAVLTNLGIKSKVKIISEQVSNDEKEGLIAQAAVAGSITLLTREFGRGTDFKCYDDRLNVSGGVHVIQTFVSDSVSEETQIKGRTARQGNLGSYSMVLLDQSLERFGITSSIIADMRSSARLYETIDRYRREFFNKQFVGRMRNLEKIREDHSTSQTFIHEALLPGKIDEIKEFLRERNQYAVTRRSAGSSASSGRTIVLMDATGSMTDLLTQAKNTVETMFSRACEILQAAGMDAKFELQFAVYRNYNCTADELLQYSEWESDPAKLRQFLSAVGPEGGWGNEAIEIGLWHVNHIAETTPVDQVILIGDMPPNDREEVTSKRADIGQGKGECYWQAYPNFSQPTYYENELAKLVERKIPVHAFYVKPEARSSFQAIASATGGESDALDIHSSAGADKLTDLVTKRILNTLGGDRLVDMYEERYGHLGRGGRTRQVAQEATYSSSNSSLFFTAGAEGKAPETVVVSCPNTITEAVAINRV